MMGETVSKIIYSLPIKTNCGYDGTFLKHIKYLIHGLINYLTLITFNH